MVKALAHLKDSGNKYYQDVIIQCTFCDRKFEENDTDVLEHIEMCHLNAQDIGETEVEDNTVQDREEDESNTLPTIKKYQAQDDILCIEMKNPQVNIVINNTKKAKTVPIKDSVRNKNVVLAPCEGKIPSAIMRTIDFDVKAFPLKHPSGNYGLDYERTVRLYKQQYFRARLFHYSGVYANDNDYLFMCQQYIERASLEAQINISGQKGTIIKNLDGTKTMKLNDAFSVFQKVPGTPKYWQQKKYNLLAMVNVLGPFQWFFTFSCAELRWPQIIACLLRKKGHKVEVEDPTASTENAFMPLLQLATLFPNFIALFDFTNLGRLETLNKTDLVKTIDWKFAIAITSIVSSLLSMSIAITETYFSKPGRRIYKTKGKWAMFFIGIVLQVVHEHRN